MQKTPSLVRIEEVAFRRQQIAFCVLTLFVLAVLLLLHVLFAPLLGEPSKAVILLLCLGFSLKVFETIWLQGRRDGITEETARIESSISIISIFILTGLLAFLTNRDDSPYFVLLAIPILQCAYHFGLIPTVLTIVASVSMIFAWIEHYFAAHPPAQPTEFLEAGMISVIFSLMGLLVWYLVNQLKQYQTRLQGKMAELESAREKLVVEEKLAAVGRFASGIAHEIRNPVAMIASSLATAAYPTAEVKEREEMFAIAAREAQRLENLTTEFLTYARPSDLQLSAISVGDILGHIANVTKMRATDRSIDVRCCLNDEIVVEIDAAQIEGALLNLTLNAIDATPDRGTIELRGKIEGNMLWIEVVNSGRMIPDSHLAKIFEPFFTTKPRGTGLGLAIARSVAIAHGGDLWVSTNQDGNVAFTMTLMMRTTNEAQEEATYGQGASR